jgi:uncharacterized FlaG/YvyC family protein
MAIDALTSNSAYMDGIKQQKFEVTPVVNSNNNSNLTITESNEGKSLKNTVDGGTVNKDDKQKDDQTTVKQLKNAVVDANKKLKDRHTGCEFIYHDEVNRCLSSHFRFIR